MQILTGYSSPRSWKLPPRGVYDILKRVPSPLQSVSPVFDELSARANIMWHRSLLGAPDVKGGEYDVPTPRASFFRNRGFRTAPRLAKAPVHLKDGKRSPAVSGGLSTSLHGLRGSAISPSPNYTMHPARPSFLRKKKEDELDL